MHNASTEMCLLSQRVKFQQVASRSALEAQWNVIIVTSEF